MQVCRARRQVLGPRGRGGVEGRPGPAGVSLTGDGDAIDLRPRSHRCFTRPASLPRRRLAHRGAVWLPQGALSAGVVPGEWLVLGGGDVVIVGEGNAIDQKKGSYRVRQVRSIGPRHVLAPRGFVYVPARRRRGRRPRCFSGPRGECGCPGRPLPLRRSLPSKHAVGPTMAAPNATGIVPLIPGLERPGGAMPAAALRLAPSW